MPYKRMVIAVGIFVVTTVILLVLSALYIISKKGVFTPKYQYQLVAQDGNNLTEGMAVVYSGFQIGTVVDLKLTDIGEVVMYIEIPQDQRRWLRMDSVFVVDKPLIGSPKIIVNSANLASQLLPANARRQIYVKDGINEVIDKVQPLLDEVQAIVQNVNAMTKPNSAINRMLEDTQAITHKVSRMQAFDTIDATLLEVKKTIEDTRILLTDSKGGIIPQANRQLLGEHNSTLSTINAMLKDLQTKLKSLDGTIESVNTIGTQAAHMSEDILFTLQKSDLLIDKIDGMISSTPKDVVELP